METSVVTTSSFSISSKYFGFSLEPLVPGSSRDFLRSSLESFLRFLSSRDRSLDRLRSRDRLRSFLSRDLDRRFLSFFLSDFFFELSSSELSTSEKISNPSSTGFGSFLISFSSYSLSRSKSIFLLPFFFLLPVRIYDRIWVNLFKTISFCDFERLS